MARVKFSSGLLLSAALLVITASCVNKNYTLGTSFIPSDQHVKLYSAEFDLPVHLRMADSLQTAATGILSVGAISSEIFGSARFSTAATITPATDSIVWGKDPELESANLYLFVSGTQVLEDSQSNILQNFYVHQLKNPLDSSKYYNCSITEDDFYPEPVSEGCAVFDGSESITIPLKKDFIKPLFNFTMEQLDSTQYLVNRFHGLAITCDEVDESTFGGRINNFSLSDSYISLTYRYTSDEGIRLSRTLSFNLGSYWSVNSIETGSECYVTDNAEDYILAEGMSGITPVVAASDIKNILDSWIAANNFNKSRVLITRASLEFPFEYSGKGSDYDNYPMNLFPCRRVCTTTGRKYVYYDPNEELEDDTFSHGDINRSIFNYQPDASIYIQNLLKGDRQDFDSSYDLWLMPTVTYIDSNTGQTYYYVDYSNYYQAVLNGTKAARHPVMKLTYALVGGE